MAEDGREVIVWRCTKQKFDNKKRSGIKKTKYNTARCPATVKQLGNSFSTFGEHIHMADSVDDKTIKNYTLT